MATVGATITNNKNSKEFDFRGVGGWRIKKSQGVISVPFIDTTPANTFLFRFIGQTEEVTFNFVIFDDNTDVSNGDSIITVNQQIAYLKDTIYSDEFDADWTLEQPRYYGGGGVLGVITNLDIDEQSGAPLFARGTISFLRGRIGAL